MVLIYFVNWYIIFHMENLKENLAKNLIKLRKANNLTQLDLANKLNYSDKAISKWERAESMPDVEMLYTISQMFDVTIDWLVSDSDKIVKVKEKSKTGKRVIIGLLSILVAWIVATIVFVILSWVLEFNDTWLSFIYAIPVSAIIWLVFNSIWGRIEVTPLIVSVLLWTAILSVYLTIKVFDENFKNNFMIFFIAIPLQVADILWFFLILFQKRESIFKNIERRERNKKQ